MYWNEFTIWGETLAELDDAVEEVDNYMAEGRTGRNVIVYQIIGEKERLYWDSGHIDDQALADLELRYIIAPSA